MRTLDFSPLLRATVGFDPITDLMDRVLTNDVSQSSYPPYNIEKSADDTYRISVAAAGFSKTDLSVEVRENLLIISGSKSDDDGERVYLHRGIATRAFERKFHLADHVHVSAAHHADGMLHVDLKREIPEALKPRKIAIAGSANKALESN